MAYGQTRCKTLQRARHLKAFKYFNLVAGLDAVILHAYAALGARLDFVDVILETAQGFKLAFKDHDIVTQHTNRTVATHGSLGNDAAGNIAQLAGTKHFLDLRPDR